MSVTIRPVVSKLFEYCLRARAMQTSDEQCGFIKNLGCAISGSNFVVWRRLMQNSF
jgi:hypothetical protein